MFTEQQEKWLKRIAELFMRLGIKSLTMDDVARELGISKKTLYQFVESKDDLVNKVIEMHLTEECSRSEEVASVAKDALDEMLIVVKENIGDMQRMKANIIFELQKYHRDAWELLQEYQRGFLYKVVRDNLERGIREGYYRNDFDVDITAKLHLAQSFAIFDESWFPKPPYSGETLFREAMTLYLHSVLSEKGRQALSAKLS
jgi:AcrR family transcriptional regulator